MNDKQSFCNSSQPVPISLTKFGFKKRAASITPVLTPLNDDPVKLKRMVTLPKTNKQYTFTSVEVPLQRPIDNYNDGLTTRHIDLMREQATYENRRRER